MIHHVTLEVHPDHAERYGEMLGILGFSSVEAPEVFHGAVPWFERGAHQIHLILTDQPTTPLLAHPAFVQEAYNEDLARLREAGFEVEPTRELWGAPRAFLVAPGGGRIELMAAPPSPQR